jgi:branched-chain amino acid transport system ATP-binding protein
MARPVVLLDEPWRGWGPLLVKEIFQLIRQINAQGVTVLLVEQNARQALGIANRGYVLEKGRLTLTGRAKDLMNDPNVVEAYLGAA